MRMTVWKNPSNGVVMEPELAIFYNQAKLPAVGVGYQPNHTTCDLQFALPTKYTKVMVVQNVREEAISD